MTGPDAKRPPRSTIPSTVACLGTPPPGRGDGPSVSRAHALRRWDALVAQAGFPRGSSASVAAELQVRRAVEPRTRVLWSSLRFLSVNGTAAILWHLWLGSPGRVRAWWAWTAPSGGWPLYLSASSQRTWRAGKSDVSHFPYAVEIWRKARGAADTTRTRTRVNARPFEATPNRPRVALPLGLRRTFVVLAGFGFSGDNRW